MAHSVLVVPVGEMESLVRSRHEFYDPDYLSTDPTFAHAHVTVLGPFAPLAELSAEVLAHVAEICGATAPFEFSLTRVATFPNGIVHLVPEPGEPFRSITRALWRAFPAYPPYSGEFGEVAPHLTVDALGPGVDERVVGGWLAGRLPVRCAAAEVRLSWYEPGACRTLDRFPLGGAVASTSGPDRQVGP